MAKVEETKGWVCENSGSVASGDFCKRCGRSQPFFAGWPNAPGSHNRIYGAPEDPAAARFMLFLPVAFGSLLLAAIVATAQQCAR